MMKQAIGALTLIGTMATANAGVLLQEDCNQVANLTASGWVLNNLSPIPGEIANWYQGVPSTMEAQAGFASQYIAASYLNATAVDANTPTPIENWLITPTFSVEKSGTITFWANAAEFAGYSDQLAFGLSTGSSTPGAFTLNPVFTVPTGGWTRYVLNFTGMGAGAVARFGIQYSGDTSTSNFVGVDSLLITAVPEPGTVMMFGAGLVGLMAARRRRTRG
jgi:hypothetical protein